MTQDSTPQSVTPGSLAVPLAVVAILTLGWVLLTRQTGLTYHLAPGLIAAAPGFLVSWSEVRAARSLMVIALALGVAATTAGWVVLEISDSMPTATFFHGQPGGVRGEIVAFVVLGAALAGRSLWKAQNQSNP